MHGITTRYDPHPVSAGLLIGEVVSKAAKEEDVDIEGGMEEDLGFQDDQDADPDFELESEIKAEISSGSPARKKATRKIKPKKEANEDDIKPCSVELSDLGDFIDKVDLENKKCRICFRYFKSAENVVAHMQTHARPSLTCKVCGKKCKTNFYLKEHLRHHSSERVQCRLCEKAYIFKRNCQRHYVKHHKMKQCLVCDELINLSEMAKHNQICKPKSGIRCDLCQNVFKDETTLSAHMIKHIPKAPTFKCQICRAKFDSTEILIEHVKQAHPDRMQTVKCENGRSTGDFLKCKICQFEFNSEDAFALHQASHIDKKFKCIKCGAKFTSNQSLTSHMETHDKDKVYTCSVCKKEFARARALRIHLLIHKNNKGSSVCPQCGKVFR